MKDLGELEPGEEEIAELRLLLGRRRDLAADQNRTITPSGRHLCPCFQPSNERRI